MLSEMRIELLLREGYFPDLVASLLLNEDIVRGEVDGGSFESEERMARYLAEANRLLGLHADA